MENYHVECNQLCTVKWPVCWVISTLADCYDEFVAIYEDATIAGRPTYRLGTPRNDNRYQLVAEYPGDEIPGVINLGMAFAVPDPVRRRGPERGWIWSSGFDQN